MVNPYASPASPDEDQQDANASESFGVDFVPIMWRWERLRLIYNALLIPCVVLESFIFAGQQVGSLAYWIVIALGGGIANICFFAGPMVEVYARCFRLWHPWFSYVLLVCGLLLTMGLAGEAIISIPNFP